MGIGNFSFVKQQLQHNQITRCRVGVGTALNLELLGDFVAEFVRRFALSCSCFLDFESVLVCSCREYGRVCPFN